VKDIEGAVLAKWTASASAGLNKTTWDMTRPATGDAKLVDMEKKFGGGGKKGGGFGFGGRRFAAPGDYRVEMTVEGEGMPLTVKTTVRLEGDPNLPPGRRPADDEVPLPKYID
jgi:hypothetical protein